MQIDLFDVLYDDFKFTQPLRTITLFSGIGFQEMGMDLAEIPYEMIGTSEIDKFAILSYAAIHTDYLKIRNVYNFPSKEIMLKHLQDRNIGIHLKTHKQTIHDSTNIEIIKDYYLASVLNKNLGDISKVKGVDIPKNVDLLTYSFPCTDLSKAGRQDGLSCGTRSGLVYEVLRILYELKEQDNLPKVLIMENVIDLIQVKFIDEWNKIALEIEQLGYTNFTQELNSRDYGIAQNRRRVFMVSILGDHNYNFPQKMELEYKLKDYLEQVVDEKYYLSDNLIKTFNTDHPKHKRKRKFKKNQKPMDYDGYANTITTRETNVVDSTFIKVPEATKQGYALAKDGDGIYINRPHQKRGVVQDGMIQTIKANSNDIGVVVDGVQAAEQRTDEGLRYFKDNLMGTLRATDAGGDKRVIEHPNLKIRKLTPRETGRLMGMQDHQINKQLQVTSRAQSYKQHGNGIIAQVIGFIIGMMWYRDEQELKEVVMKNSFQWKKEDKQ